MRSARLRLWLLCVVVATSVPAHGHDDEGHDPSDVRRAALAAGLGSLRGVRAPRPADLDEFLNPGTDARRAAVQLGKALFWDMQVGSDGQACASCHFHAGADSRATNQLHPGQDPSFDPTATGTVGPNTTLTADDFPFHQLEDPLDRMSVVLFDTDDVCSSQGVVSARYAGLARGDLDERARALPDALFHVGGVNVRRVEPRNAPSVINAVFNATNFWDGRAHPRFNGVNGSGPLDPDARISVQERGRLVRRAIALEHASLASQAVGPPTNDTEMSFVGRPFRDVGRKLLGTRALAHQLVHPEDSVLGPLARARLTDRGLGGKRGLTVSYGELVRRAFQRRYWAADERIDGYTVLEENFSLFFGLAVQRYEATLVSDRTPFDKFLDGDDTQLDDTALLGLLVFLNRGGSDDPVFVDVSQGNCVSCHAGPALTTAALLPGDAPIEIASRSPFATFDLDMGDGTAFRERGFANIGVRPTAEDLGRGGTDAALPLSPIRQRLLAVGRAPVLPACGGLETPPCPEDDRALVDGAFKVPGLRNVALTGPYFHNGGQATLPQVIRFYERRGDFSDENLFDLDPDLARVDFVEDDEATLVAFLHSLTDGRVRNERAPFDHPQLFVPDGHPGDQTALACVRGSRACDAVREIPAVGALGRRAAGLPPLATFLGR